MQKLTIDIYIVLISKEWVSDFSGPSLAILFVVKVPCILDHQLKVFIIVNWTTNVVIVFFKFFHIDGSITALLSRMSVSVVSLKCVQEFTNNFVFSLLIAEYIWVLGCIENSLKISNINFTTLIFVKLSKCLSNDGFSSSVHTSSNLS